MNIRTWIAGSLLCVATVAMAHTEAGPPQHGGVVALAADVEYELVVQPTVVRIYARAHDKAPDFSQANARLTLLSGGQTQEVRLKGAADKLEATGTFNVQTGAKAVAVIERPAQKPVTVRFVFK